jgi:S-adenosylmethionine hydrolase
VAPGEAVVLTGSDGLVEIAVNRGRAADALGAANPGDPVRLEPGDIGS